MRQLYFTLFFTWLISLICPVHAARQSSQTAPDWELGVSIPLCQKDLEKNIAWAGEAGFKWLEADLTADYTENQAVMEARYKAFKAAADKAGLKIWSIHIPYGSAYDPSEEDAVKRAKCQENILRVLESAKALGSYRKAILHPSYEPIDPKKREAKLNALKQELKELAPLVEKTYHVRLALECLPRTCLMNTAEEAMDVLSVSKAMDNCFDTNHLLKELPQEYAKAVGSRIGTIHVSDYDRVNERHWIPGKGVIDWVALVHQLQKSGYKGPFMFEVTTTPWKDDMKQFYIDLAQSWKKIKSDYRGGKEKK